LVHPLFSTEEEEQFDYRKKPYRLQTAAIHRRWRSRLKRKKHIENFNTPLKVRAKQMPTT